MKSFKGTVSVGLGEGKSKDLNLRVFREMDLTTQIVCESHFGAMAVRLNLVVIRTKEPTSAIEVGYSSQKEEYVEFAVKTMTSLVDHFIPNEKNYVGFNPVENSKDSN
jgi:hypothetical protein